MVLDVPTTAFSTLLISFVLSLYFWALGQKSLPWVRLWALANTVLTAGLFLFLGQGRWDPWLSVVLGNLLILSALLILEAGIRRFCGRPTVRWMPWIQVAAVAVLFPLFTFVWPSYEVRVWVHTLLASGVFLRIMGLLVRHMPGIRARHRLLVDGFAAVLGLMVLVYQAHGFLVLGQGLRWNLDQNEASAGIFLAAQVMVLLWTLGFSSFEHFRTQHELQVALATRDRLFSLVAHDLRGPVGNVAVMLQSMVEDGIDEEDRKESLAVTARAAEDSFRLLENLLDWSRSQRGGVQLEIKSLDAEHLLAGVVKPLRPLAAAKGQHIRVEVPPGLRFKADSGTLGTVVRNLVSNAIKFSPKRSEISVLVRTEGPWAAVEVVDLGPGLPPGVAEALNLGGLPPSTPGTDGERGTGLGLSLCQEFLKLNQGTLELKGGTDGTRVTARVPLG